MTWQFLLKGQVLSFSFFYGQDPRHGDYSSPPTTTTWLVWDSGLLFFTHLLFLRKGTYHDFFSAWLQVIVLGFLSLDIFFLTSWKNLECCFNFTGLQRLRKRWKWWHWIAKCCEYHIISHRLTHKKICRYLPPGLTPSQHPFSLHPSSNQPFSLPSSPTAHQAHFWTQTYTLPILSPTHVTPFTFPFPTLLDIPFFPNKMLKFSPNMKFFPLKKVTFLPDISIFGNNILW